MNRPKVVKISGPRELDVVTQDECYEVSLLQAAAWNAHTQASVAACAIKARLSSGGELEPGDLYFDFDLNMIRSKHSSNIPLPPQPRPDQLCLDFDGRIEPRSTGPTPAEGTGTR